MRPTSIVVSVLWTFLASGAAAQGIAASAPGGNQLEHERKRVQAQSRFLFAPKNPLTDGKPSAMPKDQDIEREMQRVARERRQLFDDANPALTNTPNSFPNIATPARSELDLDSLAARYADKAGAKKNDGLLVFASFSMPHESLRRVVAETSRAGGLVVLRGFKDNSMKATTAAIGEFGQAVGAVQVNPNAFTKYRINAVPAVVLMKPEGAELVDTEGCALPDNYVMVAGDVTLRYALEHIERRSPQFRDLATRYGRSLKGTAK